MKSPVSTLFLIDNGVVNLVTLATVSGTSMSSSLFISSVSYSEYRFRIKMEACFIPLGVNEYDRIFFSFNIVIMDEWALRSEKYNLLLDLLTFLILKDDSGKLVFSFSTRYD